MMLKYIPFMALTLAGLCAQPVPTTTVMTSALTAKESRAARDAAVVARVEFTMPAGYREVIVEPYGGTPVVLRGRPGEKMMTSVVLPHSKGGNYTVRLRTADGQYDDFHVFTAVDVRR